MTPLTEWLNKVQNAEQQDPEVLKQRVVGVLREIYDPEIPVNIYDLGLIYGVECGTDGVVDIHMTLTSPGCPVAQTFPGMVESRVEEQAEGVVAVQVELVWDPPWSPDRLTDEVKLELGLL
jgi:FeS assembly SUF system protein